MATIFSISDEKVIENTNEQTILESSLQAGIPHVHLCGGYARCSTCRVLIVEGIENCSKRDQAEQALADRLQFGPEIRLACQTRLTGDITMRRLALDDEDAQLTNQLRLNLVDHSQTGYEQEIAILFADIRDFTSFAETQLPYDVVHALNRFFFHMGEVISQNNGYINSYLGDGLMALFGLEDNTHASLLATKAGFEMVQAMDELKPYLKVVYQKSLDIGVGVHCGPVVVGSIGAADNKKITVIGDAVNLASRIESANKEVGTHFLISESVYAQVKDLVEVGLQTNLSFKGKTGEYTLYEVTGLNKAKLPRPKWRRNKRHRVQFDMGLSDSSPPSFIERIMSGLAMWMLMGGVIWTFIGLGLGLVTGLIITPETGLAGFEPIMAIGIWAIFGALLGSIIGMTFGAGLRVLYEIWLMIENLLR